MSTNVLIISPEDWGECWVSKHHYAAELGKRDGYSVYFIGQNTQISSISEACPGVRLLSAPVFPRGFRFFPSAIRRTFTKSIVQQLEAQVECKFDLAWSFDGSRFLDLDLIASHSIFHVADLNDSLPWQIPARKASLCLGCSFHLAQRLHKINTNSHFLRHGCLEPSSSVETWKFETKGPNVVFAGNLANSFLDREKMLTLVSQNDSVTFHFFGSKGDGNLGGSKDETFLSHLSRSPNVIFHGSVPPDTLSAVYSAADLLLVCLVNDFHKVGSPHKIMEYLASGTPVLTTHLPEYEEISDIIVMESETQAYVSGLTKALKEGRAKSQQRKNYAFSHLYSKQLEKVESILWNRT